MTLVVEDGTGRDDAESLITLAEANSYHQRRGNSAWVGDQAALEAALVRGSDAFERMYSTRWSGVVKTSRQVFSWPRVNSGYSGVPRQVQWAVAELSLREFEEPGSTTPDFSPGETIVSATAGPLSFDVAQDSGASGPGQPSFPIVDGILAPLFKRSGGGALLLRA